MSMKKVVIWFLKAMMPPPLKLLTNVINFTFNSTFYSEVKPIFQTLRILGRLPVHITDKGIEPCSWCSWPVLFSLANLLVQDVMTGCGVYFVLQKMYACKDYDEYLFWLMLVSMLAINVVIPLSYWVDAKPLCNYLDQWAQFQNEFFINKSPLSKLEFLEIQVKSGMKFVIFWVTVLNIPIVTAFTVIEMLFVVDIPFIAGSPYMLMFTSIISSVLFWCSTCKYIMKISDVLFHKTVMAVKKDKADDLQWCRHCWVALSNLTIGLGSSLKYSLLLNLITLSISFVVSMYACLSAISNNAFTNYLVATASELPIVLAVIFLVFDSANSVTNKMNLFLQSLILRPPVIKLADFVTVDRSLVTSFGANVITYMIVLLQFRESGARAIRKYYAELAGNKTSENNN